MPGSASVIFLPKIGNPAVNIMHHERWGPKISNNMLEQLSPRTLDRQRRRCIGARRASSRDPAGPLCLGSGRNPDTHTALGEQSGATGADAGSATNDQCNVLYRRLTVMTFGLSHVPCSHKYCHRDGQSAWRGFRCLVPPSLQPTTTSHRPRVRHRLTRRRRSLRRPRRRIRDERCVRFRHDSLRKCIDGGRHD